MPIWPILNQNLLGMVFWQECLFLRFFLCFRLKQSHLFILNFKMRIIKSFVIFLFAFILIVLLFELLLSFGGILEPIVRIDPEKGERYYPNKITSSLFVSEGFGLAKTNSSGWFGEKFKDDGSDDITVGVVGSSWVAARQVFYRDNFLSVAEKKTNDQLQNKKISIYKFGKEDLPLREMLYIKDDISATYNPDRILVFLNKGSFRD